MPVLKSFHQIDYKYPDEEAQAKIIKQIAESENLSEEKARDYYKATCDSGQYFTNGDYLVCLRAYFARMDPNDPEQLAELCHMSVIALDPNPVISWDTLQEIKNEIMGVDCEGVELYPSEDRNFDSNGQHHIWFLPPGQFWPIGFHFEAQSIGAGNAIPAQYVPSLQQEVAFDQALELVQEKPKDNEKAKQKFKEDFDYGKECYLSGNFKIPFGADNKERLEAYILGQKAGALELLYERHQRHNPDLMAKIGEPKPDAK